MTRKASEATKTPKRRRPARGILWLIASAFALSGLLRFGGESGRAIAATLATADDPSAAGTRDCAPPPDIAALLAAFEKREARLQNQEQALQDRMQALTVAETQIAKNMAALKDAEASLERTMTRASTAAEDDLVRLTNVYENMKPKEAAPLFAAMAPQFAAGFLGRMRPDSAAQILAGLDPEAAYSISVILAGRNAEVPTQ